MLNLVKVTFEALAFLAVLGSASAWSDESLPVSFYHPRPGFTLSLPTGWAQMPAAKLEKFNESTRHLDLPHAPGPLAHYGYEMTNHAELFFQPYVTIRVTDTGGPPDPKVVKEDMEKGFRWVEGVKSDTPIFDADLCAFLQRYTIRTPGIPAMRGTTACFLTKTGFIKMFFWAPDVGDGETKAAIQQIIRNVRVDQKAEISAPAPPSRVGLLAALVSIATIVLVLARAKPANRM